MIIRANACVYVGIRGMFTPLKILHSCIGYVKRFFHSKGFSVILRADLPEIFLLLSRENGPEIFSKRDDLSPKKISARVRAHAF